MKQFLKNIFTQCVGQLFFVAIMILANFPSQQQVFSSSSQLPFVNIQHQKTRSISIKEQPIKRIKKTNPKGFGIILNKIISER